MADTLDLKSSAAMREGSNPSTSTSLFDATTEQNYILRAHQKAMELRKEIDCLCSMSNDWVTQVRAAELLGVSRARVSKMVMDGLLRGATGISTTYIYKSDIDERIAYIKEHGKPTRGKAIR